MTSLTLLGDTSGSVVLDAPPISGSTVLTLPTQTGTLDLRGPTFSAYPSAAVSIANNNSAVMTCNVEEFDIGGCYNNTGSTVTLNGLSVPAYSFCPNVAGYYLITATTFLVASSGAVQANIEKNGTGVLSSSAPNNSAGIGPTVAKIIYFNGTGDSVRFSTYQTSGGTVSTLASRGDLYNFCGAMVRGA